MTNFTFQQLLLTAILVEAIINTLKPIYDKTKGWQLDRLLALAVALIVCVAAGIDLFALVGIPLQVPILGSVLTGIMVSRGANFIHDLIKSLQIFRENLQDPMKK